MRFKLILVSVFISGILMLESMEVPEVSYQSNSKLIEILDKDMVTELDLEKAIALITNNADINLKNKEGNTILLLASKYGYEQIVKRLFEEFEQEIDINIVNNLGQTALNLAANNIYKGMNYLEIVSYLINATIEHDKFIRYNSKGKSEIEILPTELIFIIFSKIIRDYINSYDDILDFYDGQIVKTTRGNYRIKYKSDEELMAKMLNIRLTCRKFNLVFKGCIKGLESIKNQLRKERFNYLREKIKSNYSCLTINELNLQFAKVLDELSQEEDKENLETYKEGIILTLAGADAVKIKNKKGYNFLMYVSQRRLWMPLLTEVYPNLSDWGIATIKK